MWKKAARLGGGVGRRSISLLQRKIENRGNRADAMYWDRLGELRKQHLDKWILYQSDGKVLDSADQDWKLKYPEGYEFVEDKDIVMAWVGHETFDPADSVVTPPLRMQLGIDIPDDPDFRHDGSELAPQGYKVKSHVMADGRVWVTIPVCHHDLENIVWCLGFLIQALVTAGSIKSHSRI